MTDTVRLARPLLLVALLALAGCDRRQTLFRLLDADRTGIGFANTITPSDDHRFVDDAFLYNGAGVAIGDVNGDGLADVYLTGNMVSSRLYLNRGEMRFEDVTESAGVGTTRWATGASMADIDADGDLDIYVSVAGPEWTETADRANLLFLNDGDATFREAAAAYGLADTGYTTHAAFLDYDVDGDLDVFLLANSPGEFGRGDTGRMEFGAHAANPAGFDQLYRNEGNGTFTNVSERAGLRRDIGYGLGVAVSDVDRDGWPDIYVSNDFTPSDALYVNNRDGTFTDRGLEWLGHTSFAGMGVDVADFSNDGWPDIVQMDMMPEDLRERQRVSGFTTYADLEARRRAGFAPQYTLNTLQLNQGVAPDGSVAFSEISRMAGVAYTDWSWSALFADYDNDRLKDLLVTNGYPKAVNDLDYQTVRQTGGGGDEAASRTRVAEAIEELRAHRIANYAFRNEGDLTFSDRSGEWGLDELGYGYGAAYADLDNDGRLDLVINNIDSPASVYHNAGPRERAAHFLQVKLDGEGANRRGVGAKVVVTAGGEKQYLEQSPYRGFMSSVDDRLHFGLGEATRVDTLEVIWPDGRHQRFAGVDADRIVVVRQREARARQAPAPTAPPRFRPLDPAAAPRFDHPQNTSTVDFTVQPLLPYQVSRLGPPLATADVNGDGLEDLFVGGTPGTAGKLFLQQPGTRFVESPGPQPWTADSDHEDWGALFFDANGDRLPDLYLASGGYHLTPVSPLLQDRLYLNRGDGRFERAPDALPEIRTSTATVRAGDYNGDGRLDLFVGGRLVPEDYPRPARSYILRNDGGRFTDVTREVAPELVEPGGLITDALWMDYNADGRLDLVTAGTWMPVRFLENDGARLRDATEATGLPPMRGWWYRLAAGDLDGDGRMDLVAGNLGLNSTYVTSEESRFGLYATDADDDRRTDAILTQEIDGTEYPFNAVGLVRENYAFAARYPTFEALSRASVQEIFGETLDGALRYEADTFASVWLHNTGSGTFASRELPRLAQVAPVRGILVHDVDGDGNADLLLAGNTFHTEPNVPPADAGKGLWLRGDGEGNFTPVSATASGFHAPLDARDLALVATPAGKVVVVANHGGPLQAFLIAP